MLNHSADYALRAVLFVARHADGGLCSADTIATALGVPRNYLGKVLHGLVRARVLASVRGPHGGFRLAADADALTLEQVVGGFQRLPERRVCLLGDRPCDAAQPCGVHQRWQHMTDPIARFFRETTVAVMLEPLAATPSGGAR